MFVIILCHTHILRCIAYTNRKSSNGNKHNSNKNDNKNNDLQGINIY